MKKDPVILFTVVTFFTFSCTPREKSTWTEKHRADFYKGCIEQQVKDTTVSEAAKKELCACLLKKFEQHYPEFEKVSTASFQDISRLGRECLHGDGGSHK